MVFHRELVKAVGIVGGIDMLRLVQVGQQRPEGRHRIAEIEVYGRHLSVIVGPCGRGKRVGGAGGEGYERVGSSCRSLPGGD